MESSSRICVQWPRLGPLHLNRLRGAHEVLAPLGIGLVALETASSDAIYEWRLEDGHTPYERVTLFPGRNYDHLDPRAVHRAVTEALDRINPGAVLIHSYSTPDARAALAWCRRRRRVAIDMAESTEADAKRNPVREAIKRVVVSQFDAAQTSGSASLRYAVKLGIPRENIFVGYSVVDNDYFAARAEEVRRAPEAFRGLPGLGNPTPFFLASNRFIARKNLPMLLRAYAAYRERTPDPWRLVMLGDGFLRPTLEEIVRAEAIEGVTFAGFRQIEDLPVYYALARAFVHSAEVDQWGLVVNEAMAAGLPVIVSDGAGCAEDLVRDGENGYRFPADDQQALAACMYRLAHEDDRAAMAARSREIIAEWPLRLFGTSLHAAAQAGAERARSRGFHPLARLLMAAMRQTARSMRSFHSVES